MIGQVQTTGNRNPTRRKFCSYCLFRIPFRVDTGFLVRMYTYTTGSSVGEMDTRRDNGVGRADVMSRGTLRRNQETDNPCYKEHLLSLRCLDSNQKDHDACEPYFVNYKNCKHFWASVQADRKLKGIKPYLPPIQERVKIKADYLNSSR